MKSCDAAVNTLLLSFLLARPIVAAHSQRSEAFRSAICALRGQSKQHTSALLCKLRRASSPLIIEEQCEERNTASVIVVLVWKLGEHCASFRCAECVCELSFTRLASPGDLTRRLATTRTRSKQHPVMSFETTYSSIRVSSHPRSQPPKYPSASRHLANGRRLLSIRKTSYSGTACWSLQSN